MLMSSAAPLTQLENESEFIARHIGITEADEKHMLSVIGEASRRALIDSIVPASIARSQAGHEVACARDRGRCVG
ncbi:MAG: hypothetical protein RL686_1702 [Pseudomonadota bacterium]